jgi:mannose-1-phosphate guanylyltransferase
MTQQITPVILCGGSGTRLWPLSRKSFPKQFVPLIGDKSLLQLTFERVRGLGADPLIVAAEDHRFMVTDVLQAAAMSGHVMLEPVARNTAAAMAIAALTINDTKKVRMTAMTILVWLSLSRLSSLSSKAIIFFFFYLIFYFIYWVSCPYIFSIVPKCT